jgi:peptide/nickel transport system permease protein
VGRLLLGRLGALVAVLLALTLVIFIVQSQVPTDPVAANLGAGASRALVKEKRAELGYDKPITVQYWRFLKRMTHGDIGTSLWTHDRVLSDIGMFAPASVELALVASVLIFFMSLALGLWSAAGTRGSGVSRRLMVALASAPTFFLGLLAILVFYSWLSWLPASGRTDGPSAHGFVLFSTLFTGDFSGFADALKHVILPALVVAVGPAVAIGRVLRGALLTAMRQDHIRTARSKGMSEMRVLLRHALRNSMTPTLAMAGLQTGLLLTGVVVVEVVFAWPGLGLYTANSLANSDFPAVVGVTLVLGVVYVLVNGIVDVLQAVADPRLREAA